MGNSTVIIIGAGPASLIAAAELASAGIPVQVYEQNKAAGRKFLVAGHGGFNLTHSEDISDFVNRYDTTEIQDIVRAFDNMDLVGWFNDIGIPTYVGSSGKVFPEKNIKPIQVLQAILAYLDRYGVQIFYGHRMVDFDHTYVEMDCGVDRVKIKYQRLLLGLGGGSWAKTGSDGKWMALLESKGIKLNSLRAANSGLNTISNYSRLAGKVLKNIHLRFEEIQKAGEILFTRYGIEGSPVYYMNRFIRKSPFPVTLYIDLKPKMAKEEMERLLGQPNVKVIDVLRNKIKLSPVAIELTKELSKEVYTSVEGLAYVLKHYPIQVDAFRDIDEVISTAGGVYFSELDSALELRNFPGVFCIGEMLNWEAPTGGYLLQACFSSGHWAARKIKEAIWKEMNV
ncbi:MAG: NAD(P)/FAD-dependent oxidoreductase [Sphingobacterium sp.]